MNVIQVYKKSVLEQIRDSKALLLTLLSPLVFIVIFGLAFGRGYYTYDVAVTNADDGALGQEFIQELTDSVYSNGNKVFTVVEVPDRIDRIQDDLKNRRYAAHLYISSDFSRRIQNVDGVQPAEIKISGDPAYSFFSLTEVTLENFINNFVKLKTATADPVRIISNKVNEAMVNSEFDAMAPGLIMMSVYFLLILSAMVLTREAENKTLQRLILSRLKTRELYAGITLSQMTLAVIMLPMVIASTYMLGFRGNGSIGLTFFVGCLAALSSIGIGMIIASFSRNGLEAFIIGNVVLTPMFFLSGVFFPSPDLILFSVSGMEVGILSLLPSLPAVSAANKVLINSMGFSDILPDLALLAVLTIAYWLVGVFLFDRRYISYR